MKLFKKLVAVASTLAMVATMTSAITVSAVDDLIAFETVLTETSEGVYDLGVLIDTTGCKIKDAGGIGGAVGAVTIVIGGLDPNKFNTRDLIAKKSETVWDDDLGEDVTKESFASLVGSPSSFQDVNKVVVNVKDDTIRYVFNPGANYQRLGSTNPRQIITFKGLKLKDGVETEDVKIQVCEFSGDMGVSTTNLTSYNSLVTMSNLNFGEGVIFPGNKVSEPTAEPTVEPTVEPTPAPVTATAAPVQAADGGNVFVGKDGISAVAGVVETVLEKAVNQIKWKISVTPVGDNAYTGPTEKTATLANVEGGNIKVGLIVAFDEAEIANVEIIGIEY